MKSSKFLSLKILVVDDEFIAQQVLASFASELTQQAVQTAANGQKALEILKHHKIDFVLTDINMPQMDGIEFTRAVRTSQANYKNIPILGITANQEKKIIQDSKTAGMNAVLIKPVSQEQLADVISELLSA